MQWMLLSADLWRRAKGRHRPSLAAVDEPGDVSKRSSNVGLEGREPS
jgi:hypothetical protein